MDVDRQVQRFLNYPVISPQAYIEMEDSIFCINTPVNFRDTSLGGKYVYGVNTGAGFSYECDTIDAVAWEFTPNTGYTVTSGSLGNYSGNTVL